MRLTVNDYLVIKKLLLICKQLKKRYEELIRLEICGNKGNNKYNRLLYEIEELIEKENIIFDEYILSSLDKCDDIVDYLLSKLKNEIPTNISSIINYNFSNLEIKRIFNRINDEINFITEKNIKENEDYQEEDDEDSIEVMIASAKLAVLKVETDKQIIEDFTEKDKINSFLAVLEDEIANQKNVGIKAALIRTKYYISYICPDIEKLSLNNIFTGEDYDYKNAKAVAHNYDIPISFYESAEENFIFSTFYNLIACLYAMKDSDYNYSDNVIVSVLKQIMIKTWAIGIPNDIIEDAMDLKELFCENKLYDNTISQRLIKKTLKESLNKKHNQKVISIASLYR